MPVVLSGYLNLVSNTEVCTVQLRCSHGCSQMPPGCSYPRMAGSQVNHFQVQGQALSSIFACRWGKGAGSCKRLLGLKISLLWAVSLTCRHRYTYVVNVSGREFV